jgi:hypothetical protein
VTRGPAARLLLATAALVGCAACDAYPVPAQAPSAQAWGNLERLSFIAYSDRDDGYETVQWRIAADSASAWHVIDPDTLAGVPGQPVPIWSAEAVAVVDAGPVGVIGAAAPSWAQAAEAALQAVESAELGELLAGWQGTLVVEAPGSKDSWQAVMGVSGDDMDTTAAITWALDFAMPVGETAAVHVVVNPVAMAGLDAPTRQAVLTHEAVHVATFAHRPAAGRQWASEGLADLVAFGEPDAAAACAAFAEHGAAIADADFKSADPAVYEPAFALARAEVSLLKQSWGQGWDARLAAVIEGADPPAELADWLDAWCA